MINSDKGMTLPSRSSTANRGLLTPVIIAGLLAMAVLAWLASLDSVRAFLADQHAEPVDSTPVAESGTVDPDRYTQAFLPVAVAPANQAQAFYLYVSPTTENYLIGVGGDYELLVTPWRQLLTNRGYRHKVTNRLSEVPRNSGAVVILPSSVALNAIERQELRDFQAAGGSLLATWSTGSVDESGEWKGDQLLSELFGVRIAGELQAQTDQRFLNLFGETPLTVGYPAGIRIWLNDATEPALKLAGSRSSAIYSDWNRSATGATGGAAILHDEHGPQRRHARWVSIGFPESAWAGQEEQLSGLMENALNWLARGTAVTKSAWPAPYRAAYLIEMDTEDGFANARHFADMMDDAELPATFYALTSEAIRYPYLVRYLSRRHEIAYHGDVHVGFRDQPEAVQKERLERMQSEMSTVLGHKLLPTGFRAPEEKYDRITETLLHEMGMRHHTADPARTDARLPFFAAPHGRDPQHSLVILPRTQHDDISLRIGVRPDEFINAVRQQLVDDFDNALRMGALGLLSVHSQYFGKNGILYDLFPSFLAHVNHHRSQVWVATGNDISQWWRDRERLSYQVGGNAEEMKLTVKVDGNGPLQKASLIINNRGANVLPVVSGAPNSAQELPKVERLDAHRSLLVFDSLPPGIHTYLLTVPSTIEP